MSLPRLFRKKSRLRSRKNNYRLRSVIFTSLDYQLFSVMRSSLRSERRRSELLFERSEESEGVDGLGILPGEILRIPEAPGLKIPHIGWNSLSYPNPGRLFTGVKENSYVYFVHSYYLRSSDPSIVTAETEYGTRIHASVEKDNIFACQFHPEKSSAVGLTILKNFISLT